MFSGAYVVEFRGRSYNSILAIFILQSKQLDYELNNAWFLFIYIIRMYDWTDATMIFLSHQSGTRQKLILHICDRWNKCQSCCALMSGNFRTHYYWTKTTRFLALRRMDKLRRSSWKELKARNTFKCHQIVN